MEAKVCTKCNREKSLDEFSFKQKDKGFRRSDCKECNRKITRNHYKNNKEGYLSSNGKRRLEKRKLLLDYLLDKSCADCSISDSRVLEFDHVRGVKVSNVSSMVQHNFSWEKILQEIAKCDIVCANCHRIRTSIAQGWIK